MALTILVGDDIVAAIDLKTDRKKQKLRAPDREPPSGNLLRQASTLGEQGLARFEVDHAVSRVQNGHNRRVVTSAFTLLVTDDGRPRPRSSLLPRG